jgi:putative radical SAM enzyme (TIGR03279 family)
VAGGRVAAVAPHSIGHQLGILPGDVLVEINGQPVRDLIDYRFLCADHHLQLRVVDGSGRTRRFPVSKHPDQSLGLEFAGPTFDGVLSCVNACSFCFVDALPPGVRDSLRLKDDDYRLSFLHGNFITLTNLTPDDWDRIRCMRLSPLYVSVHATNPVVRSSLLGNQRAGEIMSDLGRLTGYGVEVHAQVVIVPGKNDGEELDRTLRDLAGLWPGIRSVGVVPVGTTAFGRGRVPPVGPAQAQKLLAQVHACQVRCRPQLGVGFAYAADELYLNAGQPFPAAAEYDEFPQLENGIGLSVGFLEELSRERAAMPRQARHPVALVLITGVLARPLLEAAALALGELGGVSARVVVAGNGFFGPEVTVAGLLAGRDLAVALAQCRAGETAVIPGHTLRDGRFLDDACLEDVARSSPVPVRVCAPHPAALFRLAREGGAVS